MFSRSPLPDNPTPVLPHPKPHTVLGSDLMAEPQPGQQVIYLAGGCYWGVEEIMWQLPGVVSTAVGFMGGQTANPTYRQVCSGLTGHTETVRVVASDEAIPQIIKTFWEMHDPTSLNRQGNDVGTQYRSAIFVTTQAQQELVDESVSAYSQVLSQAGQGEIVTEILPAQQAGPFYLAEDEHQQYLDKNPFGYRCHAATGMPCPMPGSGPLANASDEKPAGNEPQSFIHLD
ncbi:peptide-methionine (S)-S-oxide reductase MsrA [Arcanobacterium pinnipediorum]|uniref:Peptide methionine sulfoxide reductase MsrA n=1 Tax=Arcanobacterium pinnipediorum TaxID=1503041 RepID=A0ABY5AHK6_9ACTO|nr:peptide-methionine (S)-S-oxide reductase MsrA [Arcanobacterium pinnipediorum]USR79196.1 peptide-methionine (S)-S-oxide reductase MsrA [Arcanobacterium pinnipediorum]